MPTHDNSIPIEPRYANGVDSLSMRFVETPVFTTAIDRGTR